ncbi:glycoside hydrolase, partial [Baffinella frigidus]
FDVDVNVSVFETNIRALGGLLAAHFLAEVIIIYYHKHHLLLTCALIPWYTDQLIPLAKDLADRLLPAFDTKTGVPYGTVNLRRGVPKGETVITSAAGGGTVMLEFTVLSRLLGDDRYEAAARRATVALWTRKSKLGLVGNHINIASGAWTHQDAGLGVNIDSFYEYLVKAHLLLGDSSMLAMFSESYAGIMKYLKKGAWYLDANMHSGTVGAFIFSSLATFWPGVQVKRCTLLKPGLDINVY